MKKILTIVCIFAVLALTSCSGKTKNDTQTDAKVLPTSPAVTETERVTLPAEETTAKPSQTAAPAKKTDCELHDSAWHTYKSYDALRTSMFDSWAKENNGGASVDGCPRTTNIYRFIRLHGITRAEFEKEYYGSDLYYIVDHNVDLLFGASEAKAEAYYRTDSESYTQRKTEREQLIRLAAIKRGIISIAEKSEDTGWRKFFDTCVVADKETLSPLTAWSIADLVRTTGIGKAELKELISSVDTEAKANSLPFDYTYLYNTLRNNPLGDTLYDKINEDNVFCGITLRVGTKN